MQIFYITLHFVSPNKWMTIVFSWMELKLADSKYQKVIHQFYSKVPR